MVSFFARFGVPFVELVDTTGRVDDFLLAREKRMAFTANFYFYGVTWFCGGTHKLCAASALEFRGMVIGMSLFFHSKYYTQLGNVCQEEIVAGTLKYGSPAR